MKLKTRSTILWIAVVVWMAVIFFLSAQDGSSSGQLSNGLTKAIYDFLTGKSDLQGIEALERVIRTLAHAAAYFILALIVIQATRCHTRARITQRVITLLVCALYAATDEWHQAFVPGRACEILDFAVDMAGSAVGILIHELFGIIRKKQI